MARHSAFEEPGRQAVDTGGDGGPVPGPGEPLLIRVLLARGEIAAALERARRALPTGSWSEAVDLVVDLALEAGRIQIARNLLAHVEAEISPVQGAHIRARIALCDGDLEAATAILVAAVEAQPGAALLRSLLAEVMVAGGTAADVRAVLSMLGRSTGSASGGEGPGERTGADQRLG